MESLATIFSPEGGHFALAMACALACLQALLPMAGLRKADSPLTALARPLALSQCLALLFCWACLITASLGDDFSLKLVAETSAIAKPWPYKIAGLWGNHEGSLLLWVTLLGLWGSALALMPGQSRHPAGLPSRLRARLLALLGLVGAGFALFCLTTSNPFLRLWPVPMDGTGMNPLLQDPGLAIHPPLLYGGYVGFAVPFAFAIATLLEGRADALRARYMRPWVISAWGLLTLGITLGSWWSYAVLGWGGYWFWDPVENAALIPWLTGTALLHSVLVAEKRNQLHGWCQLLAIATFALSLSGTFLVRSGILNSVHAFANDPARGIFILSLLGLYGGGGLLLFALRGPAMAPATAPGFTPLSREGALVLNSMLLCTLCAVVLTGTLYPPFMQLLLGRTLSVGKPFFDATTIPLTLPLLAVMGASLALPWRQGRVRKLLPRLAVPLLVTAGNILPAFWLFPTPLAAGAALLALWVITAALCDLVLRLRAMPRGRRQLHRLPRSLWAASLAHIGVGVTMLGLCGMAGSQERLIEARPGTHTQLAGQDWSLTALIPRHGPDYEAVEARLLIRRKDSHGPLLATLRPQIRLFPRQGRHVVHVAILHRPLDDLYAALGSVRESRDQQGQPGYTAILRLHENPLASWIWLGGIIMALGGGLTLLPSRRTPRRTQPGGRTTPRNTAGADKEPSPCA